RMKVYNMLYPGMSGFILEESIQACCYGEWLMSEGASEQQKCGRGYYASIVYGFLEFPAGHDRKDGNKTLWHVCTMMFSVEYYVVM
ncbi:hypothetical protein HAX54_036354, partial [Datura stramonium]|nr:hypothetical protein [Datura stramonium]